ncbi:MAG TPA: hypothetical protein VGJ37_03025 [Pyrinomonadaceae bacterium]|jgi:hypothetical protein
MPVPNNPFQNPFYNRFNDPVTRRQDDVEAYAWLRSQRELRREAPNTMSPTGAPPKSDATLSGVEPVRGR